MARDYEDIINAREEDFDAQIQSEISGLPPGYISGFEINLTSEGRVTLNAGIANVDGRQVAIDETHIIVRDEYLHTPVAEEYFYIYLTPYATFVVTRDVPILNVQHYALYHPTLPYRYLGSVYLDSSGFPNLVLSRDPIRAENLSSNVILSRHIGSSQILAEHLSAGIVTTEKLDSSVWPSLSDESLELYYPFDDKSDDVVIDYTGNENDASLVNGSYFNGISGKCVVLSTSSGKITSPILSIGSSGSMSFSFFVNVISAGILLSYGNNVEIVANENDIKIKIFGYVNVVCKKIIGEGWKHIVIIIDASGANGYINSVLMVPSVVDTLLGDPEASDCILGDVSSDTLLGDIIFC